MQRAKEDEAAADVLLLNSLCEPRGGVGSAAAHIPGREADVVDVEQLEEEAEHDAIDATTWPECQDTVLQGLLCGLASFVNTHVLVEPVVSLDAGAIRPHQMVCECLRAVVECVADLPAVPVPNLPVWNMSISHLLLSYVPMLIPPSGIDAVQRAGLRVGSSTLAGRSDPPKHLTMVPAQLQARVVFLAGLLRFRLAIGMFRSSSSTGVDASAAAARATKLTPLTLPNLFGLATTCEVANETLRAEYVHALYDLRQDSLAEEQLALINGDRSTVALILYRVAHQRVAELVQQLTQLCSPAGVATASPRLVGVSRQLLACVAADLIQRLALPSTHTGVGTPDLREVSDLVAVVRSHHNLLVRVLSLLSPQGEERALSVRLLALMTQISTTLRDLGV